MRPDKKKRNRGKYTEKSEGTQAQGKEVDSKGALEKEEAAKTKTGEDTEQSQAEKADKAKLTTTSSKEVSNDNLPAPTLRRETDALKEQKKPSKRQIFSDWKEYDKPILPEDVEEEQLRDFSSLIQQNIGEDNYFKFKHERQWENNACSINKDLFNLNLHELSAGLQCIPFYERLNISTALFSKNEVKRMEKYSKEQEKVYDTILNSQDCNPSSHIIIEKLIKGPEIQLEEECFMKLEEESVESLGRSLQMESGLVECLTSEKQNIVDGISSVQPKESKVEESQLNFFKDDVKPVLEDNIRENNSVENKSHLIQEEKVSVTEKSIVNMSTPVSELEVKHESKEVILETIVKPSVDAPIDTDITESSPMDMNSVFESSPLGQRVKPKRSRETKDKSKSKVVNSGDEDKILDSLLSLKEPTITAEDPEKKDVEEAENAGDNLTNDLKSIVIHEKKENLEAWLDSMLDD